MSSRLCPSSPPPRSMSSGFSRLPRLLCPPPNLLVYVIRQPSVMQQWARAHPCIDCPTAWIMKAAGRPSYCLLVLRFIIPATAQGFLIKSPSWPCRLCSSWIISVEGQMACVSMYQAEHFSSTLVSVTSPLLANRRLSLLPPCMPPLCSVFCENIFIAMMHHAASLSVTHKSLSFFLFSFNSLLLF